MWPIGNRLKIAICSHPVGENGFIFALFSAQLSQMITLHHNEKKKHWI